MKTLLLSISIILSLGVHAQLFPEKCIGTWTGTMHLYKQSMLMDSVKVRFTVAARNEANTWTWKMEYLSDKMPMVKDYVLRLKDRATRTYVTDEGGGVELTDHEFGDKLYDAFETSGFLLTATYELQRDTLVFEVTSGKRLPGEQAGITNFSVTSLQRVVMVKEGR